MKHIEYKNIVGGLVSDVDQKTRSVKVVFSKMGNTDLYCFKEWQYIKILFTTHMQKDSWELFV